MSKFNTILLLGSFITFIFLITNDEQINVPTNVIETKKNALALKRIFPTTANPKKQEQNSHAIQQKSYLEIFNYYQSKIISANDDEEKIREILQNPKAIHSALETLSFVSKQTYSNNELIDRERAITFLSKALDFRPNNEHLIDELEKLIKVLLKDKHKRIIQKTLNADTLDLLAILHRTNPERAQDISARDRKIMRYYQYMLALQDSINSEEEKI